MKKNQQLKQRRLRLCCQHKLHRKSYLKVLCVCYCLRVCVRVLLKFVGIASGHDGDFMIG